jgi:hypothetical protein
VALWRVTKAEGAKTPGLKQEKAAAKKPTEHGMVFGETIAQCQLPDMVKAKRLRNL